MAYTDLPGTVPLGANEYGTLAITALFELIWNFQDCGVSGIEAYTWFMTDIEQSWMDGTTSIEDR